MDKKELMQEIKQAFKKHYSPQFHIVFGDKNHEHFKYASTQWHAFKCGYFSARGMI